MAKYDKFIGLEFGYDADRLVYMTYTGSGKPEGLKCCKCEKRLVGKTVHFFTGSEDGEAWHFGPECVRRVFGTYLEN